MLWEREREREGKFKIGEERLGRKWIKIEESVGSQMNNLLNKNKKLRSRKIERQGGRVRVVNILFAPSALTRQFSYMKTEDSASADRVWFNNNWFLVETRTLRKKQIESSDSENHRNQQNPSPSFNNTLQISSQISTPAPNRLQISHFVSFQEWIIETQSIFYPENKSDFCGQILNDVMDYPLHSNLMNNDDASKEQIDLDGEKLLRSQTAVGIKEISQDIQEINSNYEEDFKQAQKEKRITKNTLEIEENEQINLLDEIIKFQGNQSGEQVVEENNQNQQSGTVEENLKNMLDQFSSFRQIGSNCQKEQDIIDREATLGSKTTIRLSQSKKQGSVGNHVPAFYCPYFSSQQQQWIQLRSKNTSIQTDDSQSPEKKINSFSSPGFLPLLGQISSTPQSNLSNQSIIGQNSFPFIPISSMRQIPTQSEEPSPQKEQLGTNNSNYNEPERCSESSSSLNGSERSWRRKDKLPIKKSISKSSKTQQSKHMPSQSPILASATSIKRDRKNLVKNFIKAFRNYLNSSRDEQEVISVLGEQAAQLAIIRNNFEKNISGKNFNNSLMVAFLQNKEFSVILSHFLKTKARDWITVSKIKDKLSHYEALDHYLLSLVDSKELVKVRCLQYRQMNSMDEFFQ